MRLVRYDASKNRLAALPTVLKSMFNGRYDIAHRAITVTDDDLVGWFRTEYESLTLILLVDVSKSTWPFIEVFKEILGSLTGYFHQHNDRVGLISLQGQQAKIYNHPTHNFRVVARGLSRLKFHGETPIADGLLKSMNLARIERSKNPGSRSIVILLSDCYPEPLARGCDNVFEDPAYRNSLNVAGTYRKAGLTLLVINPAFESEVATRPGEILADKMVKAAGGKLIKLLRPPDRRHARPSREEMDQILSGIESTLTRQQGPNAPMQ